jgi:hypothetical protein
MLETKFRKITVQKSMFFTVTYTDMLKKILKSGDEIVREVEECAQKDDVNHRKRRYSAAEVFLTPFQKHVANYRVIGRLCKAIYGDTTPRGLQYTVWDDTERSEQLQRWKTALNEPENKLYDA